MVVPLEPGGPSEARQLLRTRRSATAAVQVVQGGSSKTDRCTEPGEVNLRRFDDGRIGSLSVEETRPQAGAKLDGRYASWSKRTAR